MKWFLRWVVGPAPMPLQRRPNQLAREADVAFRIIR